MAIGVSDRNLKERVSGMRALENLIKVALVVIIVVRKVIFRLNAAVRPPTNKVGLVRVAGEATKSQVALQAEVRNGESVSGVRKSGT